MPPAAIRRPVTITTWVVLSIVVLVFSPLLYAAAALAAAILRRPQPLLLVRFAIAYFALELRILFRCGVLWVASGFGARIRSPRFRALHYELVRTFVCTLAQRMRSLLDIDIAPEIPGDVQRALASDQPLLFFSRHAGPGDTLLLVDLLLRVYNRLPSVVFKDTLAIDPCVDLVGHRLPQAILDTSNREESEERIEEVSRSLDPRGVLVLFPEGGNFTPQRRRRALRKLWRRGRRRAARQAREMEHVMPPQPTGACAAMRGQPDATVIFSAHTGLGLAAFPKEIWRHTPIGATLHTRMWLAPAAERPTDPDQQIEWLYRWWQRIDQWLEQRGEPASPEEPAATEEPAQAG